MIPFTEIHPRSPEFDRALIDLRVGPMGWRVHLARLYLMTGRHMPDEAKEHGVFYGFCDAAGVQKPMAEATHIGWRVAPPEPTEDAP